VGYITYKHQAVQRRFGDRVLWQRLSRGTPIYGEDLIRTAELSEATIYLDKGPGIELAENTLIQIRIEDGKTTLHLNEGGVALNAPDTLEHSFTLVSGDKRVELSAGTALSAAAGSGGELNLQVAGGSVTIAGPGGAQELRAGESYAETPPGIPLAVSPQPNTRLFVPGGEVLRLRFTWTARPAEGLTRLEIAEDRRFNRIVKTRDLPGTSWETELDAGVYWWRVSPVSPVATGGTENQGVGNKLSITRISSPRVISPQEGYTYRYKEFPPQVLFQWALPGDPGSGDGPDFIFMAADNPAMRNPQVLKQIQGGADTASFIYSGLGPGQWYWQVQVLYEGYGAPRAGGSFTIEHEPDMPPPPPRVALASLPPPAAPPAAPELVAPEHEVPVAPVPAEVPPPPRQPAPRPAPQPMSPPAPPPPRPAPQPVQPVAGQVIQSAELRRDRSISFRWNPVPGAAAYVFTLYAEASRPALRRQILRTAPFKATSYTLDQLSLLDRGTFVWRVEAVSPNGMVTDTGENSFVIDVPALETPRLRDPGILYGE
jgi:hypothetical protein